MSKKILSFALAICFIMGFTACKKNNVEKDEIYKATIFSDLHYGTRNYNNFNCVKGLTKLEKIIYETDSSDFYINLGDFIDNMGKNLNLYNEAIDMLNRNYIEQYNTGKVYEEDSRIIYSLIGNHETNTIIKSEIAPIMPYVENVGQVYSFSIGKTLFVAIDANFNRENGSDAMADMYCTEFTIPQAEIDWFKTEIDSKLTDSIEEVIFLSHIAVKDIEQKQFWKLVDYVWNNYNIHVTMFDGHTHSKNYTDYEDDNGVSYFTEYTLPATTTNNTYFYYNVTFKNGKIDVVEQKLSGTIEP